MTPKPLLVKNKVTGKLRSRETAPDNIEWRPANGAFSRYEVADAISPVYGDRGIIRCKDASTLVLQSDGKRLYKYVTLKDDSNKRRTIDVHLLMVIGAKPSEKHTVDHILPGKLYTMHNFSTDLRWATRSEQRSNQVRVSKEGRFRLIRRTDTATGEITTHLGYKAACTDIHIENVTTAALIGRAKKALRCGTTLAGFTFSHTQSEAEFKPIPAEFINGNKGYKCSKQGGLIMFPKGKYTTGQKSNGAYRSVTIDNKPYKVHRLIAATWVEGYAPGLIVNHIDHADDCNNDASNLEWCTHSENNKAAAALGVKGRRVKQYTLENTFIAEFVSMAEAARHVKGMAQSIRRCCEGRRKTTRGFIWKYSEQC
jgi:HNH endonuclease